jgi:hypothetical protein
VIAGFDVHSQLTSDWFSNFVDMLNDEDCGWRLRNAKHLIRVSSSVFNSHRTRDGPTLEHHCNRERAPVHRAHREDIVVLSAPIARALVLSEERT